MKKIIINVILIIMLIGIGGVVQAANNTSNTSSSLISTKTTGNGNAKLSNLGTKQYDFTGFKPDETSYDITVPESVEEVTVYATTQDKDATYKVTGDKNLKRGENKVTVTVTASDGKTTMEYYINVRRLGDPSKNPVEEPAKNTTAETQTTGKKDQSDITRYSEPHTEVGWYIVGISLAVVTVLLIVFVIIDDYKKPEKKARRRQRNEEDDDEYEEEEFDEDEQNEEQQELEGKRELLNNSYDDTQATKVLKLDEIKNMQGKLDNKKGKHF